MDIVREFSGVLVDRDSGAYGHSVTQVYAMAKARRLSLPFNRFLSNRFILNNISEQGACSLPTSVNSLMVSPARDSISVRGD